MANYCSTNLLITHPDHQKIQDFLVNLDVWLESPENPELENTYAALIEHSGVENPGYGERSLKESCVVYTNVLQPDTLVLDVDTPWTPLLGIWKRLIDKYLPGADVVFRSFSSDEGLYTTNDQYYIGKYIVDPWDAEGFEALENVGIEPGTEDCDEETIVTGLQKLLETSETSFDKLRQIQHESKYSEDFSIHVWEASKFSDWN